MKKLTLILILGFGFLLASAQENDENDRISTIFSECTSRSFSSFNAVIIALVFTGIISAKIGQANILRATIRVVIGGTLAMIVTYGIGIILKVNGI